MQKEDKERVVAELTERLRTSETLIVSDYRGLTMKELDGLRTKVLEQGATFSVVKNSLAKRAAEAAGADALLALLEGPSAIAFLDADGDAVAVAKALADSAKATRILTIRGGVMQGRTISGDDVQELAKLPPVDVLRGQVVGAITAPIYAIVGLFTAPLTNLVGLIDARIEQLEKQGGGAAPAAAAEAPAPEEAPAAEAPAEAEEPAAEAAEAAEEPTAEAAPETDTTTEETTEEEQA